MTVRVFRRLAVCRRRPRAQFCDRASADSYAPSVSASTITLASEARDASLAECIALPSLEEALTGAGFDVDLRVPKTITETFGVDVASGVVWLGMTVGASVGSALLDHVVSDLYEAAKTWAARRWHARKGPAAPRPPVGFVIYGPDGRELKRWVEEDGDPRT